LEVLVDVDEGREISGNDTDKTEAGPSSAGGVEVKLGRSREFDDDVR
jgi:hypothetical protein